MLQHETAGPRISIRRMSLRVKLRRTQREHISSGLPLKADTARCSWHVSNVPLGDITFLPLQSPLG